MIFNFQDPSGTLALNPVSRMQFLGNYEGRFRELFVTIEGNLFTHSLEAKKEIPSTSYYEPLSA